MEINPRFQATIEAIELVTRINLVKLHLEAHNGHLPRKSSKFKASCARIIVYAHTPSIIPDLREIPGVVDISHPGTLVNRGDPVCTVNHIAKNRNAACHGAWGIVEAVYRRLQPISPKNE